MRCLINCRRVVSQAVDELPKKCVDELFYRRDVLFPTVQHFILECPLCVDNRQKLQKNLFLQLNIPYLDMDLPLGYYSENEYIVCHM